jgi:hypothetical protein
MPVVISPMFAFPMFIPISIAEKPVREGDPKSAGAVVERTDGMWSSQEFIMQV